MQKSNIYTAREKLRENAIAAVDAEREKERGGESERETEPDLQTKTNK